MNFAVVREGSGVIKFERIGFTGCQGTRIKNPGIGGSSVLHRILVNPLNGRSNRDHEWISSIRIGAFTRRTWGDGHNSFCRPRGRWCRPGHISIVVIAATTRGEDTAGKCSEQRQ